MKKPKYIEKINLPLRLSMQEHPEFYIYKIEKEGNNYRLSYLVEDSGVSVFFEDELKFKKFPEYFEIQSGGWYGDRGRWTPRERYAGSIICEDVKSFKEISKMGKNYKFQVTKTFLSFSKTLIIESEKIGVIEIKCKKIIPQEYAIMLFSKTEDMWVSRNYVIKNLEGYLNDTIEHVPF